MIPYGNIPKSYKGKDTRVHYLTCRKTIYGVHRTAADDAMSKTCIMCFTSKRHAITFKDELMYIQTTGRVLERCLPVPNVIHHPIASIKTTGSMLHVSVETSPIVDLMKMCHMNYFDMYLVFDIDYNDSGDRTFSYYDFNVLDQPTRGYLNYHLNYLLDF